jgi:hypothetical protein
MRAASAALHLALAASRAALARVRTRGRERASYDVPFRGYFFCRSLRIAASCAASVASSASTAATSCLSRALARACSAVFEIGAAHGGVGEHRDRGRLHLQDAARHENQLLGAAARGLDAHRARLDASDERRVARVDAELPRFARQHDELRLAGVDALLGAHHVDVDGAGHSGP